MSSLLRKFVIKKIFIHFFILFWLQFEYLFTLEIYQPENILFYFNYLLEAIERFDFICKTKFSSLPNFTTCYLFKTCHMSNVHGTYDLPTPNFVDLGSHIFFKTNLVIIYFTKNIDINKCPPLQNVSRACIAMYMGWVLKLPFVLLWNFFRRSILIGSFLF